MSDSELSALFALGRRGDTGRGWRCPDPAQWVAFSAAQVGAGERARLETHLADCAFCLGQVGFLMRSGDLGPTPAVPTRLLDAARERRVRFLPGWRPLAATLAAAAVLAAVVLVLQPLAGGRWAPDPRSSAAGPVRSSAGSAAPGITLGPASTLDSPILLQPLEGEVVTAASFELQWQAAPEALFYTVQVMNARGDLLWEGQAQATRLEVVDVSGATPGQPLFAWVIAHSRTGAAVRSPVVSFKVAPN